jgi:hypothetical protein
LQLAKAVFYFCELLNPLTLSTRDLFPLFLFNAFFSSLLFMNDPLRPACVAAGISVANSGAE